MGSKSSRHNENEKEEGLDVDNEDEDTRGSGTGDCDNIQSAQSQYAGNAEENIKGGWLIIDFKMLLANILKFHFY
jgi:hypothetical protein